jgi:hypothetical protein
MVVAILALGVVVSFMMLKKAKATAESLNCASSICSICLGGMLYAHDHGGLFPTNLTSFQAELNTPKILRCVGEPSRPRAESWEEFSEANSSYEIVNPGLHEDATNQVFIRCRVHGHLGYPDGTVFDGARRRTKNS